MHELPDPSLTTSAGRILARVTDIVLRDWLELTVRPEDRGEGGELQPAKVELALRRVGGILVAFVWVSLSKALDHSPVVKTYTAKSSSQCELRRRQLQAGTTAQTHDSVAELRGMRSSQRGRQYAPPMS